MWKSFASDLREEWSEPADECNDPWVLKNSFSENLRKIRRDRMPYKPFSRTG
jgi:hypothetical protein